MSLIDGDSELQVCRGTHVPDKIRATPSCMMRCEYGFNRSAYALMGTMCAEWLTMLRL